MSTKRFHVFKAGPQISAQGVENKFTKEDLQEVVDNYDPSVHEAPLVIGHSGDNDSAPAFGWIKKLEREGDDLYADVDVTDAAKDLVKKRHYKKLSISLYSPGSAVNPHKGQWSVRHLALLGASPPAVKGLESFSFGEKDGVLEFSSTLSPDELFDDELGPTLIVEKSPLELLKERLSEVKTEVMESIKELEKNQQDQTETDVSENNTDSADENANQDNPNQQFTEMKKKLGREGAEIAESSQQLENLDTNPPKKAKSKTTSESSENEEEMEGEEDEEGYAEGVKRVMADGAHGQKVQVVEELHSEANPDGREKTGKVDAEPDREETGADSSQDEDRESQGKAEFEEVPVKVVKDGKAVFTTKDEEIDSDKDREETGRSDIDSTVNRQKVGKGEDDGRSEESAAPEDDREEVAANSSQDEDRDNLGQSTKDDDNGRWSDQSDAENQAKNADQYDDSPDDLGERNKPGISDGNEPKGRDGGPTILPEASEEGPDNLEMAVDVESAVGNDTVRVMTIKSSDPEIKTKESEVNHQEPKKAGISDGEDPHGRDGGPTKLPMKSEESPDDMELAVDLKNVKGSKSRVLYVGAEADPDLKVSDGTDARGRDGGDTEFPTKSEESPDDMELAVDLDNATTDDRVRIVRQKSGQQASIDLAEVEVKVETEGEDDPEPMTETGFGSTSNNPSKKRKKVKKVEKEMGTETDEFSNMGSMAQASSLNLPDQIYKEFEALRKENEALRKNFQNFQVSSRRREISSFVESLYEEGKLTDAVVPQQELQSYCEGLEFGTLEFSEGETPTTRLFSILNRLPQIVSFSEVVPSGTYHSDEEEEDFSESSFHDRALNLMKNGKHDNYMDAIKDAIWGSR